MPAPLFILLLLAIGLAIYAGIALTSWVRMRGRRIVTCPENQQAAAVEVDTAQAVLSAILERPDLRLRSCSRWPERERCHQGCVQQIAAAPHATLSSSALKRFFAGQVCGVCHRTIDDVHVGDQKPGLLNPRTDRILAWDAIPATRLHMVSRTHVPICSNCHMVETFRREHPDLVVDRHRTMKSSH